MAKSLKSRASKQPYSSSNQLILEGFEPPSPKFIAKSKPRAAKQANLKSFQTPLTGFETPFSQKLNSNNRWVILAHKIPWDSLASVYISKLNNSTTGADGINPRVAIGAIIIKHMCNFSDRETILQIQENMYMQYFIGYSSYSNETPFDPSLFVDIRKRLGHQQIGIMNELILNLSQSGKTEKSDGNDIELDDKPNIEPTEKIKDTVVEPPPKGYMILDATACPQDISYPTDLNLLNDAREKSEELIDLLYNPRKHTKKPRTYRQIARKKYLKTAQKKRKTTKEIRMANRRQLSYLRRNLKNINLLLDAYDDGIPLDRHQYKYLLVIQHLFNQQQQMFIENSHSIEHRIVSIHQPHVRPIVRGKSNALVEFGAKINASIMNGYTFLDDLEWEAYNEGTRLMSSVFKYRERFGYYPEVVMVDKIYCTRDNRAKLKALNIMLKAKPLGRPKAVVEEHVRPGERNPIEGKFGQAKTGYGMNRIKARLQQTSESWIATIILVLNLVKLAGEVPLWLLRLWMTYSARITLELKYIKFVILGWLNLPRLRNELT